MMPLIEMMMSAQNGEAIKAMARQYGLSEAQVEQAMEALMPAFSTGLKRNAQNPMDVSNFLSALASGNHAKYFEDVQNAFTPAGMEEGNGILGHLFGSKEVSRAVAAQASAATGIGQEVLKQMLPVLASAIMGGLFKQSTGQVQAAAGGGTGNVIGDLIAEMMKNGMGGMGGGSRSRPQPSGPMDNPLGQILEGMFGGGGNAGGGARRQPETADPFDNPLGQIFKDMLGGGGGRAQAPEPEPDPEPAPRGRRMPSGRERNPYDDLFGNMFETGREVQKGYQKSVESIFDQYLQGMNRHR